MSKAVFNLENGSSVVIITTYDQKPIPIRIFDWSAVTDNYDINDPIGYGKTEIEAIKDLIDQLNEVL
jgi:hypothetical protein